MDEEESLQFLRSLRNRGNSIHIIVDEPTIDLLNGLYFIGEIGRFAYSPYEEGGLDYQVVINEPDFERLLREGYLQRPPPF